MDTTACEHGPAWTLGGFLRELPAIPRELPLVAGSLVDRPITGELRERIMLAVAVENRCRHCMRAHSMLGRRSGIPRAQVDRLLRGDWPGADEAEAAALAYARDRAQRHFKSRDETLWAALDAHYGSAQKKAIEASARVMNFANRSANAFDALLARFSGC